MKTKFTLVLSLITIVNSVAAQSPVTKSSTPQSGNWYAEASAYIHKMEFDFYPSDKNFRVTNSANRIGFIIHDKGYTAYSLPDNKSKEMWAVEVLLHGIGRSSIEFEFEPGHAIHKEQDQLLHQFDFGCVQYINNEKGLRQNFIISSKPSGNGDLRIELGLRSTLSWKLIGNNKVVFHTKGNENDIKLKYEDLNVWDANHRKLSAAMRLDQSTNKLYLVINDKDAVYPVTVDPLNKTAEWTTSADGVLPGLLTSLSLQVTTLYGYTVTNLGDINGDGYDDVAIGAPGMADVITGTGSLLNVGAVFVYQGSATGLPVVPSKVLQPSTAVAGALFGLSIEAGNISADGLNDIIVGAPKDSYQTTVTGLFGNVNVNVTAGKVYYYRSEDLFSSSNPSPFLQLRLQGDNFFGTGILGLLDNTSVKALFGYSIAVTDDLNGDNRQDIVIGCPAYLGKNLLSVQSGAAFVYYSNNLSTTSPVQLTVPTPSVLGLITLPSTNLNGLLYGFSVEGMGDYNNDGRPDVVVGAPAGINLSSLGGIFSGQVLGGSAYIYYGNGSGVNSSIGATLQAAPSGLLSNAANLFGYKIKSVKNSSGVRNGNVLISSVTGSVLSNIIGGLRLKAGQVHVFKRKTSAFSNPVTSDQVLSSPRAGSLLSLLSGQNLDVSMLYGAGMDNMRDINCDGYADIIIGEPLSTNVPLIGSNVTGGAAYAYFGNSNGTYNTSPSWSMYPEVSPLLGMNATSLLGFSVAGGIRTQGASNNYRALVGGPANSLDFGSGLLNLGNTMSTLLNFAFDNNGLGKAYTFETSLCFITLPVTLKDFSGSISGTSVKLNWISADEMNVNYYELQRSNDGRTFETIAMIFAKNELYNTYSYPDKDPLKGANYYRLRIINNDKKVEYSSILSFRFGQEGKNLITVAPNPVHDVIRLKLRGLSMGTYTARLMTSNGQLITVKKINVTQSTQIETITRDASLSPGTYWLQLTDSNGIISGTVNLVFGD